MAGCYESCLLIWPISNSLVGGIYSATCTRDTLSLCHTQPIKFYVSNLTVVMPIGWVCTKMILAVKDCNILASDARVVWQMTVISPTSAVRHLHLCTRPSILSQVRKSYVRCRNSTNRSPLSTVWSKFRSTAPLKKRSNLSLGLRRGPWRFRSWLRGLDWQAGIRALTTLIGKGID